MGCPEIGYDRGVSTLTAPVSDLPLTASRAEQLGRELDALREQVLQDRGAADAAYIRRVITTQRSLELAGRLLLLASGRRSAWVLGTTLASTALITEDGLPVKDLAEVRLQNLQRRPGQD